jgi:hypothetical protein
MRPDRKRTQHTAIEPHLKADCNGGLMTPMGASQLPNEMMTAGGINPIGVLTTLGAGMGVLMKGGNTQDAAKEMLSPEAERAIAPGLRMNGTYSGPTGFSLTFHPDRSLLVAERLNNRWNIRSSTPVIRPCLLSKATQIQSRFS